MTAPTRSRDATAGWRAVDSATALGFGAASAAIAGYLTRAGLVLKPDSVAYLGAAKSLAHGHGYTLLTARGTRESIVHWPPLYPAVLAVLEVTTSSLLEAARDLNLVLFGITTALLYLLLLRAANGRRAIARAGTVAFVLAPTVVARYTFALSEPLFLLLVVATLLFIENHLRTGARWALLGAAFATGLACATRNVGIALVLAGVVALLTQGPTDGTRRVRSSLLFAVAGIAPFLVWMAWVVTHQASDRSLGFHVALNRFQNGYGVIAQWLAPRPIPFVVRGPLFAIALIGGVAALALLPPGSRIRTIANWVRLLQPAASAAVLLAVAYLPVVVLTMWFLDPTTRADARIFSPLYVGILVVAAGAFAQRPRSTGARRAVIAGVGAILMVNAWTTLHGAFNDPRRFSLESRTRLVEVTQVTMAPPMTG